MLKVTGPVVLPVDFSPVCVELVKAALAQVEWPCLHLVHVVRDHSTDWEPGMVPTDEGTSNGLRSSGLKWLQSFAANLNIPYEQLAVLAGDPGRQIVGYAKHHNADLIALPSHGRGGIKSLGLGSVAERVVRLTDRPVLVLRSQAAT